MHRPTSACATASGFKDPATTATTATRTTQESDHGCWVSVASAERNHANEPPRGRAHHVVRTRQRQNRSARATDTEMSISTGTAESAE